MVTHYCLTHAPHLPHVLPHVCLPHVSHVPHGCLTIDIGIDMALALALDSVIVIDTGHVPDHVLVVGNTIAIVRVVVRITACVLWIVLL